MSRPLNIIVLGSGIAGLGACLALSRFLSDPPTIRIYEVRPQPSTIGGAINLTPNALRCLSHLGVLDVLQSRQCGASISQIAVFSAHTGSSLGKVDFSNSRDGKGPGFGTPPFKAIRITRADLLSALLETISTYPNITLHYSSRAIALSESCSTATVTFADGATASADLVLGCDGIHSAARCFVDPDRTPTYSGVAVAYGFAKGISDLTFPWQDTCLTSSRYGSLMASYYQPDRQNMYVAAVMETDEVGSREGWQVKGADQLKVREDIEMRLSQNHVPGMTELVKRTEDWFLYPVYKLPPKGKWCTDRIMLLGDAAHAMPPQGESTGLALEDAIIFVRLLGLHLRQSSKSSNPDEEATDFKPVFSSYLSHRFARIDEAYNEANMRWEQVKDSGWLVQKVKEWLTWVFLWWMSGTKAKYFEEDWGSIELTL